MGVTDKLTGRVKQAAGDILGSDDLHRQGKQEERKGEAQAELAREEADLRKAETAAEARREEAEQRAAAAARKEFDRAERDIAREEQTLAERRERHDARAEEVSRLQDATDPIHLSDTRTKDELYDEAARLDIPGRSEMSKDELADAIRRHR
jgi:uncharacterized protein YjbJ (UPF0337 family)